MMPRKRGGTCECIEKVNAAMLDKGQNQEVVASIRLRPEGTYAYAVIETERTDPSRRTKSPRLLATFCPFCGEKYADADAALAKRTKAAKRTDAGEMQRKGGA